MEKQNYSCNGCGYKFNRIPSEKIVCPFCGSSNVGAYRPTLASDLLDSVPND